MRSLPLRYLFAAASLAVVMPLLLLYTSVSGYAEIVRLESRSSQLDAAQHSQLATASACQAIKADVWEALALSASAEDAPYASAKGRELRSRVQQSAAELQEGIQLLRDSNLSQDYVALGTGVIDSLTSYGADGEALVDLALTDPVSARQAAVNLDFRLSNLRVSQSRLNAQLAADALVAETAARQQEMTETVWTSVLAGLMWLALLGVGILLRRYALDNAALLRRLKTNGAVLAATNQQLKTAQSLARVGSWEWNSASRRVLGSPEFYNLLGVGEADLGPEGDPMLHLVHPDDRALLLSHREAAQERLQGCEIELRMVRPDGSQRTFNVKVGVSRDESGLVQVLGVLQDVTELRAVEKLKGEFVSVMSHELRTPLTAIRGALGLMAGGAVGRLSPQAQRMAEVAVTSADRLVRLINDILDVEKLAAGKVKLQLSSVAVAELIAAAVREMRPMAEQEGIRLACVAVVGDVVADPDRMAQTLTNLLNNAIKFSPRGGVITLSSEVRDTMVHVRVSDQGPGIPPDQLEAVFDRFQQVDASDSREQGGTGLGLSICRGIVEQHGGTIWAMNDDAGGSTFEFTLPRASVSHPSAGNVAAVEADDARALAPLGQGMSSLYGHASAPRAGSAISGG